MDLTFSETETAFRDELRGWLAENPPSAEPSEGGEDASYAWRRDWQRTLYDAGGAAPGERPRAAAGRPDADGLGDRRAEGPLPRPDPLRRGDLVPGLLRARRRLGPRGAQDAGRQGRRRLGRDGSE